MGPRHGGKLIWGSLDPFISEGLLSIGLLGRCRLGDGKLDRDDSISTTNDDGNIQKNCA